MYVIQKGALPMSVTRVRISLKAARINAGLSQMQAAKLLGKELGQKVSRQRLSMIESYEYELAPVYGLALSHIYKIPQDCINFDKESTLSYIT